MKLLPENELIWSTVVANNTMNRERNAAGINSYEQEFACKPEEIINNIIVQKGHASWLDLCCGQGKALIQTAEHLLQKDQQEKVTLKGIDLVDAFLPIPYNITNLQFEVRSIVDWTPDEQYDLITCVHGLHYIGDKLKVLTTALASLTEEGLFMANLDLHNIKIKDGDAPRYLKKIFSKHAIHYSRKKIISCKGPRQIPFALQYEGASDEAGPNYTGQPVVDSYYSLRST